jgi:carbohydrate-selective porin OprB
MGAPRTDWIIDSRVRGRIKYGFGVNVQQEVSELVRVFGRLGWADGKNEAFAYTEIDNTIEVGFDVGAGPFGRANDRFGFAAVTNGLSEGHRTYLALGGSGFLLGDGNLNYGRENILEAYYTAQAYRGVFPAIDVQLIDDPGYNKDRGPILVASGRLHLEI